MALYLDEVWLKDPSPERMKEFTKLIGAAAKSPASIGAPQEVRFAGGPWFSNERAQGHLSGRYSRPHPDLSDIRQDRLERSGRKAPPDPDCGMG